MESIHNSEKERATKVALGCISRRMHTCKELSDKLKKKKFSQGVIDGIIDEFLDNGLLNDRNFAEVYIMDAAEVNFKGEYRIRQELMQKGVARSIIDAAFDESEADFDKSLSVYLSARLRGAEIGDFAAHEKLKQHLARRGYSLGEIKRGIMRYETERE